MKDGKEFPINWDGTKTNIFFTSDTHFGHEAIIKFCNRPFKDAHEMDEVMINNWNNKVGPDDLIFHLGDFAFGGSELWNSILPKLNGHKVLIISNHDRKNYTDYLFHNIPLCPEVF